MSQQRRSKRTLLTKSQVKHKIAILKRFNLMSAAYSNMTIEEMDNIKEVKRSKTDQQAFDVIYITNKNPQPIGEAVVVEQPDLIPGD